MNGDPSKNTVLNGFVAVDTGLPLAGIHTAASTNHFETVRMWTHIRDLESLYSAIGDTVAHEFSVRRTAILLYEPETRSFRMVAGQGFGLPVPKFRDTDEDHFLNAIYSGKPFGITDVLGAPGAEMALEDSAVQELRADLGLPLAVGENATGILTVSCRTDGSSLDPVELELLMQLASQASVCIENCQLYEKGQREREALSTTLNNLSLLHSIGQAMTYISDLKSLLEYILNQAIKISNAEKGSIMLYDRDTDELSVRILTGMADTAHQEKVNNKEVPCKRFKPGEGVAGKVFQTGNSVFLNKVKDAIDFVDPQSSYVDSIACIPMKVYGEILGVINVTNRQDKSAFTDEDIDMLKAIADQAAIAISKAQLWDMAFTDSLTGLYDRRYFKVKLHEEIQRAKRYDRPFSILMADLDNFKKINDTYGHAEGDRALKAIGRMLRKQIREVDIIARYGGDEFIMFFPEKGKADAHQLAKRLKEQIAGDHFVNASTISVSIGIASYPEDGKKIEVLIDKADRAMYHAKQMGRNRIESYSEALPGLEHPPAGSTRVDSR